MTHLPHRNSRAFSTWTTVVLIVALAGSAAAPAQLLVPAAQPVGGEQTFELSYTATFSQEDLVFGELEDYDLVRLEGGECLNELGWPRLPAQTLRIAVPAGMAVTGVRVLATDPLELEGQYTVYPAQPPQHVSGPLGPAEPVLRNREAYASSEAYPAELVEFTHQTDLAGQGIALVRVYPVQYVAVEKRLTFHRSIEFVLEGVDGYECGDYLPRGISELGQSIYEQMVTDMVVNPEDVELRVSDAVPPLPGVGPGDYDYVIITQAGWIDDFQPLADWKMKKGVPAMVVDRDWIYNSGGYSGSSQAKIRAFVQDARSTWGTTFFLLGGDTNVIPFHTRYLLGEGLPNDTYYADYDADWTCEVHVGRASVRDTSAISTFINKVLTYEKNPPLSNYAKTAAFFGFDLYTYGSHEGENCKEDIKNLYLPSGWTYRREYDSEGGGHKNDVISYLNQGNNLVNHADHADYDVMGVGCTNHGTFLYNSDMDSLNNGNRQSTLYTLGCWACAYDITGCIGEHFVRDGNGGGLGFVGNSRYGWYMPYYDDQYSFQYDRNFFRSLFNQSHYHVGACVSDHKNDSPVSDDYYKYIFTELTLLGDPEVLIWTEDPQTLTVTHDATLNAGEYTAFIVQVRDGADPVPNATVCLWKDEDVYEVGMTTTYGIATFAITPATAGTMYVTTCKHNYLPYEGEAEVLEGTTYTLPNSFTIVRGRAISGGLTDLFYSDDSYLVVEAGITLGAEEAPVWLTIDATASTATPSELSFTLEAHANVPGVTQKIELFNYDTQSFEEVDVRTASTSDQVVEVLVSGDPSRFVHPATLEMEAQLTWKAYGPVLTFPWRIGIDQTVWTITP